jgi:hypothetical protein
LTDLLGEYVLDILTIVIIAYFNELAIKLKMTPDFYTKHQSGWIADEE